MGHTLDIFHKSVYTPVPTHALNIRLGVGGGGGGFEQSRLLSCV